MKVSPVPIGASGGVRGLLPREHTADPGAFGPAGPGPSMLSSPAGPSAPCPPTTVDDQLAYGFRTLSDLEESASRRVLDHVWAYIQGGSGDERTLAANLAAFRRRSLRPRVLVDVTSIDLSTTVLGRRTRAPFFVAPTAYQGMVHPEGEVAVARAARDAGLLGAFSTLSSRSLEEIAAASGDGVRWFQLYLQPDFGVSKSLVERAERAGYAAIVLTADVPVLGSRDRQAQGGFAIDASVPVGNGADVVPPSRAPLLQGEEYRLRSDAGSTWEVLDQLREATRLPIVVKGILTGADARRAVDHGARGIVVSNHGGRQLDGSPAALDALAEVVASVGGATEVYLDGGVRRGSDVLVALAMGARAVGLGRPVLWALAAGGGAGVAHYFSLLGVELATSMALAGRTNLADVDASLLGAAAP